jgi:glycosyltransferase involved in cell wall biosynthesis
MEGLPVVLMEGMALGLPVLAPRVAGVPELVDDGVNGLLFTPARWDELSVKLHKLLSDRALRVTLGRAGRSKVEGEFDIVKAVEPLLARWIEPVPQVQAEALDAAAPTRTPTTPAPPLM